MTYFAFVIDCDSFGQTIENVFALSMLVNMGLVGIYIDDEQPYIRKRRGSIALCVCVCEQENKEYNLVYV